MRARTVSALAVALVTAGCTSILGVDALPEPSDDGGGASDADVGDASQDATTLADGGDGDAPSVSSGDSGGDGGPDGSVLTIDYAMGVETIAIAPLPALLAVPGALQFGEGLAFSPTAPLGDDFERWLAIGVPGAGNGSSLPGHGAVQIVHIVEHDTTSLTLTISLLDSSVETNAGGFGHAVAFSPDGQILAVGAPFDPHANVQPTGSVFLYTRDPSGLGWTFVQSVFASDAPTFFGSAVVVTGAGDASTLLVGAPGDVTKADRVAGRVLVYSLTGLETDGGAPMRVEESPAADLDDGFGTTLAVSDDSSVLLVGAPYAAGTTGTGTVYGEGYLTSLHYLSNAPSWDSDLRGTTTVSRTGAALAVSANGTRSVVGAPYALAFGRASYLVVSNSPSGVIPHFVDAGAGIDGGRPVNELSSAAFTGSFGTSVGVGTSTLYVGEPDGGAGRVYVFNVASDGTLTGKYSMETPTDAGGAKYGTALAVARDGYFHAVSAPSPASPSSAAVYLLH